MAPDTIIRDNADAAALSIRTPYSPPPQAQGCRQDNSLTPLKRHKVLCPATPTKSQTDVLETIAIPETPLLKTRVLINQTSPVVSPSSSPELSTTFSPSFTGLKKAKVNVSNILRQVKDGEHEHQDIEDSNKYEDCSEELEIIQEFTPASPRCSPCTPFGFFVNICRRNVKKKHKDKEIDMEELIRECWSRWKDMTKMERRRFEQMSKYDQERFNVVENIKEETVEDYPSLLKRKSIRKSQHELYLDNLAFLRGFLDVEDDSQHGLEIIDTEDKGRGVGAVRDFNQGELIVEYVGELIDNGTSDQWSVSQLLSSLGGGFLFFFKHEDRKYCIDASRESGRFGRLVNHSRKACNAISKIVVIDEVPRLVLVAKRNIIKGEEILYDYGDRSKEALEAHPWLKQ